MEIFDPMTQSDPKNRREDEYADKFAEAANDWALERLYSDLKDAKQKLATSKNTQRVTPLQKACLRGLLSGYSPDQIAPKVHREPKGLRVDLAKANGLYRYVEALTGRDPNSIENWRDIADWLEEAGYKTPKKYQDWGEAPDVSVFYGRTSELETLKQWVVTDKCRLVAVLGIGGIGKTALAVKVAQQVQGEFNYVVWRSLRNAPPLDRLLTNLIGVLSQQVGTSLSDNTGDKTLLLMECLRSHRCLLVLDEWEAILQGGKLAGHYLEGYENYEQLVKVVGSASHHSCLILTSREKPREISQLEGPALPVRSLQVNDLGIDAREILREKGLSEEEQWTTLIRSYRGNPLALKIVAGMIQEFPYNGSVSEFIKNTMLLGDLEYLLHQQFDRLTELEKQIMSWLAEVGKPVSYYRLQEDCQIEASNEELNKALGSLGRRSLLEKVKVEKVKVEKVKEGSETMFDIQPVVRKYVKKSPSE